MSLNEELKERQKKVWNEGDFATIARRIEAQSPVLLDVLGVDEGTELLDVACGTGNALIPAAERGAVATGLDITPKLLEVARERAREAGLEVELIEGDAEDLPFADDSFDRVTSLFGAMFAPDHEKAAAELLRVCRPGGKVGVCAWTPEGLIGRMFMTVAMHMPPPPEGFKPPILWGVEDHVRGLLGDGGELRVERRSVTMAGPSVEEWMATDERALGPMVVAKATLEPEGKWQGLRDALVALYEELNEAEDGSFRAEAEYLMTIVELPA
jgi:SAM-dependent methyltransferase